jgi:RNA polymerase sigma-70 factor, ECF subfamily
MSSSLAREGTEGAFERLYRSHRSDVYRFVLRDVRNPADAEDVTQTAFLNAYRALQHGDRPEKPRAWLLTIAQNVARRRFRSRSVRPQEVELDPELYVAPEPEGLSAGEIREALLRLRPNHRAVIVLREIGGLSYGEIAETLNLSVSAVETLLFRARRALREELASEHRPLRVGGIAIPLPFGLSGAFSSVAGWLGRRAATVQIAGAVGATAIGVGVAVQAGALAGNDPPRDVSPAESGPTAVVRGASHDARPSKARPGRKATRPPRGASARTTPAKGDSGVQASVLGVDVPEVSVPSVALPPIDLPAVPAVPDVPDVPEVPDLPEVVLPPPPAVPLPQVELPPLPDAG